MGLQSFVVVDAFVAEERTKALVVMGVGDQSVSVVMAGFVAKMSDERTLWFMQLGTASLPFGIVSFCNVYGDDSAFVPSQHGNHAGRIRDEAELQTRPHLLGVAVG
jgi:hypothetical protein